MCGIFACHAHPEVGKFKPQALKLGKASVYPTKLDGIGLMVFVQRASSRSRLEYV